MLREAAGFHTKRRSSKRLRTCSCWRSVRDCQACTAKELPPPFRPFASAVPGSFRSRVMAEWLRPLRAECCLFSRSHAYFYPRFRNEQRGQIRAGQMPRWTGPSFEAPLRARIFRSTLGWTIQPQCLLLCLVGACSFGSCSTGFRCATPLRW